MPERGGTGRGNAPRRPGETRGGRAFAPIVVRAADGLTRWVTRVLGASATAGRESISEAELRDLVAANVVLSGEERRIIDELVGEITDEYDLAPDPPPADGDVPSEVDGRLNLVDFAERCGFRLPAGPYETLGGFLMARLGRLARVGDEVDVNGYRLVVTALDGRRVARVGIVPPPRP